MFFDDLKQIPEIAKKVGTSIFVVPRDAKIELPGAIILQPEEKTTISIEQVRAVSGKLNTRQVDDISVVIRPADKMGIPAANSLLKILEQPDDKIHFVLIIRPASGYFTDHTQPRRALLSKAASRENYDSRGGRQAKRFS